MHRRRFAWLGLGALWATGFRWVGAFPRRAFAPEDFAAVSFTGEAQDAPVKTVTARVSRWRDAGAAEEHRSLVVAGAGWVPDGEFYTSGARPAPIPDAFADIEASFATWTTTVGAAAVVTDWALLVWRDGAQVGEVRVGTIEDGPAASLAAELAETMRARLAQVPEDLAGALPTADDLPPGMKVAYRWDPGGAVDGLGTPLPTPEESPEP